MSRYYKVVRRVSGKRNRSTTPCEGGQLFYSKKSFTQMIPGSIGIFVFNDLWLAQSFAKIHAQCSGGYLIVFSCEVRGKAEKTNYVQDIGISIKSFVKMFKINKTRKSRIRRIKSLWFDKRVTRLKCAPSGTFTVQAVRLKREVRSYGYYSNQRYW